MENNNTNGINCMKNDTHIALQIDTADCKTVSVKRVPFIESSSWIDEQFNAHRIVHVKKTDVLLKDLYELEDLCNKKEKLMADLKRFNELKKQVEQEQQKADRAEGALEQLKDKLKEDFDCSTLQEAEEKVKELDIKKEKAEKAFDKALQEFDEKWGDDNDEDDDDDDD